jgi:two-component system, NarL family, sensor kinase
MKILLLKGILLLCGSICWAQVNYSAGDADKDYINRLEKAIVETSSDSIKAYTYLKLSLRYRLIDDTLKATACLHKGTELAENVPFIKAVSHYYLMRAILNKGDKSAIEYHVLTGDSLLRQFDTKESYKVRANLWQHYSVVLQNSGNVDKAIDLLINKAAPNAEKSGEFHLIGSLNRDIAVNLFNIEQFQKARSYLMHSVKNLINVPQGSPGREINLAATYSLLATNFIETSQYDSARKTLDLVKPILINNPTVTNIHLDYYYNEGTYFYKIKKYKEALNSLNKGINFSGAGKSSIYINLLKFSKYRTFFHSGDYKNAKMVLEELLAAPIHYAKDKKLYYEEMHLVNARLGNITEAYEWATRYITISDSLYKADYQNHIAAIEAQYNNLENQKKIESLKADSEKLLLTSKNNQLLKTLLATVSAFVVVIGIFGAFYYRSNKKLLKQREINYQQKLKETEQQQQMQFAKALLQGEEKERKRMAGDLHDGLGGMLARVKINLSKLVTHNHEPTMTTDLNKVIDQLDNSVNELRRIARNMMPESLVSLGLEAALTDMCGSLTSDTTHINFQAFDISTSIAKDIQSTIYRIVQELLTNAIRHAKASQIVVQCSQNESTFFITVEDNGKGFDAKAIHLKNGIGLTNVKSRVDYLGGKMDIASAPGDGTTINIELNVVS